MPYYTYECSNANCEYHKEPVDIEQKITDEKIHRCPKCNGQFKRLISGSVGLKFKGAGWTPKTY